MKNVAIITGGSSGIGLCTALSLKKRQYTVYEFSRRESNTEGIIHISCDITDENNVKNAVNTVMDNEGQIDVLINNAGFGISGAIEFTDTEDARKLFDVDFFGMVNVCKYVIPHMRERRNGRIVNLSSVAAPVSIPFQAFYSCAKSAVSSYTLSLANELRPFDVSVCAILPGDISTGFTAARKKNHIGNDIYDGRIDRSVATMENDEKNGYTPEMAGNIVANIACKTNKKPTYVIGFKYKCICFAVKLLPLRFVNYIVSKIYAS